MAHGRSGPVRTCLLLLAAAATVWAAGCGDEDEEPAVSAEQREAAQWRDRYEDLLARNEAFYAEFEDLQRQKEELEAERERLQEEVEDLEDELAGALMPRRPAEPAQTTDWRATAVDARRTLEALGTVLADRGDYDVALAVLQTAVRLGSSSGVVRYRMGLCSAMGRDYDGAREHYEAALEALDEGPDGAELRRKTLNNLGVVMEKLGEPEAAAEHYLAAIALDETYAAAQFNLGRLYARELDRPQEAIEALRKHVIHGGSRSMAARDMIEELQAAAEEGAAPAG